MKPAHRRGRYTANARAVVDAAKAHPHSVCWRDGLPLSAHPSHRSGARPTWTAGHTVDGSADAKPWLCAWEVPPPGDWLAPEASVCNYSYGAGLARGNRIVTTQSW